MDAKQEREIWILGLEEGCAGRGSTLCGYLRDGGYKSRPAKLEDLETAKPQGILLDLSPFSRDGWGILLRLISSPKTRDIPILPLYLSMEGKVGGVFPCAGFFTVPVDSEYMAERLAVMGLAEDAQMWDLRALIVSRSGEEQLSKAIEALDFEVVKAYTGKEGLALASTSPFYLAFSTLMLPDMSAFELLERLRLYPRTRNVPFFILVKDNMKEGERTAMSRQIDHLVRKKELSKEEFLGYIRRKGD
ncbi:MAG TPA: response regulator [Geobacteraceae bacterium]|nr:response regulator [Geobacteraceae bacterium]